MARIARVSICLTALTLVACGGGVPAKHKLGDDVTFQPAPPGEAQLGSMSKAEAEKLIPTHGPEIMEQWATAQRAGGGVGQ